MPASTRQLPSLAALARHPWRVVLALVALTIVVLMLLWDWNWLRGPVERQVEARTGRHFEIGGKLDVDLGRVATIRADALTFGNAAWAKQPVMARADRLEFTVEVWPLLLRRAIRIPDLHLVHPRLLLETGPGGAGNWVFGEPGMQPEFRTLRVDDGRLRYRDAPRRTDVDVVVQSTAPAAGDVAPPITVTGSGHWQGSAFRVRGTAQSPLALRERARPYRVDAHMQAGTTRAHVRGTLLDPLRLRDFDLQLALSGNNLADLYPLLGLAIPPSPPYALDGRLTRDIRGAITTWHYDGFGGHVGDSDLSGNASVAIGGPRPYLRGNLVSKRLDFDDLAGFVGKAPQAHGESTNPELAAQAAREEASPRVLPQTPYDLEKLHAMDADVRWKAQRIDAKLPLDDMEAHVILEGGLLRLVPLDFGVAGGDIRSEVRMDARSSPIRTHADIKARGLNLAPMLPDLRMAKDTIGKIGGHATLTGSGNSIARMLGSADGSVAFGMGRGQASNLVMELAGLDIEEALKFLLEGDRQIPIRCAFGDFTVAGGVMTARALAFDTTDTIIVGEGGINLRDETLALTLRPRPKDRSLLVLRSPLIVDGTFKQPHFHPDYKRVGLRSAIALTLASIAPPAALLATLELGPGGNANCGGHYAK
jgi:uncharacterized protein involved in outer membrane biogenesis